MKSTVPYCLKWDTMVQRMDRLVENHSPNNLVVGENFVNFGDIDCDVGGMWNWHLIVAMDRLL